MKMPDIKIQEEQTSSAFNVLDNNSATQNIDEEHHPWCNYWLLPRRGCKMCEGLYKNYPLNGRTMDEMMKEYFPNVIEK
jgi:hypothetical protein